jgi:hypothetical protein
VSTICCAHKELVLRHTPTTDAPYKNGEFSTASDVAVPSVSDRASLQQSNRTLKGSFLQHFSRKNRTLFLHQTVPILMQTAETEHGMSFTSSNIHEACPFVNTPGESLQPIVGMRIVLYQRSARLSICTTLAVNRFYLNSINNMTTEIYGIFRRESNCCCSTGNSYRIALTTEFKIIF